MQNITVEQITRDRLALGNAIQEAYDAHHAVNPDAATWRLSDVVERLFDTISPADQATMLRAALFDSIDAYFSEAVPQLDALPSLGELLNILDS